MNTIVDEEMIEAAPQSLPGAQLAALRIQQGYSTEYIAEKLHLRVRVIELIENDDYQNLPESVFIKGYLRAYAKLMGAPADAILESFNEKDMPKRTVEKALWQSRKETNRAEHAIRWLTCSFAVIVIIAVASWWYSNKDNQQFFPENLKHATISPNKAETEIRLTDLSKMRSLLSSQPQIDSTVNTVESEGE